MTKPKRKAKARAYETTAKALKGVGFEVQLEPASQTLTATGPCGRKFRFLPTVGRWTEKLPGGEKPHNGTVNHFLAEYARTTALRRKEAESWASLRPELTIFTDAALCPRTGASGWGAWMKGNAAPSDSFGGQIADLLKSSTEAEARAGANAFHVARRRGLLRPGMVVMWQCDNLSALRWLLAGYELARDRPAKDGLAVFKPRVITEPCKNSAGAAALSALCAELELRVLTRHVKGHLEGPNRQWVNRLCDEIAGQHMRARRQLHQSIEAGHCPRLASEARP
jgi:ribonuclease HI